MALSILLAVEFCDVLANSLSLEIAMNSLTASITASESRPGIATFKVVGTVLFPSAISDLVNAGYA